MKLSAIFLVLTLCLVSTASPLKPVRLDNPRDTMKSYLQAISDYKKGVESGDFELRNRILDATRTFDLSAIPEATRTARGSESAILLKEIMDRVILVDLNKIPDSPKTRFWRLKDTEIQIVRIKEGDREGQFLFSKDTVARIPEWYSRVKHLDYVEGSDNGAGYRETPFITNVPQWAKEIHFVIPNWQWIGLFAFLLLGFVVRLLSRKLLQWIQRATQESRFSFGHILEKNIESPASLVCAAFVWYSGVHILNFQGNTLIVLKFLTQAVLYFGLIWSAYKITDAVSGYFKYLAEKTENTFDDQLVPLLSKSIKIFVVIFGVLIALQSFGVNVMSLLAGLGLGGLAFALAAKDTAANLFGSIMILFDRPFRLGDWIVTEGVEGTVTEIGFRSTRILTFYNSEISIPNNVVANAKIDNMGRRQFRRIKTVLGLTYDTPAEKVEAFCEGVKKIIQANEFTRKDYMHVCMQSFGDFSLNILVYCFLRVNDWGDELVQRQNIYLEILRLAESLDVQFAFPTQSLHLESDPSHPLSKNSFEIEKLKEVPGQFAKGGTNEKSTGHGLFVPNHREQV